LKTTSSIQAFQLARIKKIVRSAYEDVPLYRQKYDATGVKPRDIQTLADLHKLPLLTKEELQAGFPYEILSKRVNPKNCYVVSTSGHSGSPVKLYRRKRELIILPAMYLLAYPWLPTLVRGFTGVNTGRKITAILPRDESYDLYRAVKIFSHLPPSLRKNLQYIATETDTDAQLQAIRQHSPDIIVSDLTALKNIIVFAHSMNLDIPRVKLLFVGSELIDKHSRNLLSQAFGAKVVEHYGSEEAGTIAFECPQGGCLHLVWRANYLEILKDGKEAPAGTPGEVVVTNLLNTATPIIRYSGLGDAATISPNPCSCNAQAPLLQMVDGRIVDSFVLPDGRIVHPFSLTVPLEHIPNIWRYQIRQEKLDLARVLVVVTDTSRESSNHGEYAKLREQITSGLKEILGNGVHIEVNLVDDIPQPSGSRYKMQPVISLLNR
jgi:phenylacetate-CoA ligase